MTKSIEKSFIIDCEEKLRSLYGPQKQAVRDKVNGKLKKPNIEFIKESPFICISTVRPNASADCSPKGDPPGFVQVLNEKQMIIPDRKGNNRLDTLSNIIHDPRVGILFFVPGKNETLRVNGRAKVIVDPNLLKRFEINGKIPRTLILVDIDEVYFHCPKALVRSSFWEMGAKNKKNLTSYIRSTREHMGIELSDEQIEQIAKEYKDNFKNTLY